VIENFEKLVDEKYNEFTAEEKRNIYALLNNKDTRIELKEKINSIIFRYPFPSPEEFLDPTNGWLSKQIVDSMFPYIKQEFCNIVNGDHTGDPYNRIVQYGSTRRGKTYLAHLLIIYIIIFHHCLRDAPMYYNLSSFTELCIYFISFKYEKIRQVYLSPIYKILASSKRFVKVFKQDQVKTTQQKIGLEKIVWCRSATSGYMTLDSGLQIQLGNDEAINALGASVCACFVSEIAYFCEYAGTSEDSIFRTYIELHSRILNTVGKRFLAFTYLDTSANSASSKIENHIIKELSNRKGTYFSWKSRWEALPNLYPIWQKTNETFKVITGNSNIPAKIVTSNKDLTNVPIDLIVDVPIDLRELFQDDLIGEIKNSAGRPTSDENRLISNIKHIDDMFDNLLLENIEGSIKADAADIPNELLWNIIVDKFFTKNASGRYFFKRAPDEPRYVGLDNAFSIKGNAMGLACIHKEKDIEKNKIIFVTDFVFAITSGEQGINLEAPIQFILDMKFKANVFIKALYTDTFQSETQKQQLQRYGVETIKQSVDESLNPYLIYLTNLTNETLKCGKNIFLRNNLQSLIRIRKNGKEKIDHTNGVENNRYNGDYEHSTCGIHAKDASDAHCQALYGAYNDQYTPATIYQEEQKKFSLDSAVIMQLSKNAYSKLHNIY
jgi:hypothetical protein